MGSTPKAFVEFAGGDHFVGNSPLGPTANSQILARYGLSWLKLHVYGDQRYRPFIQTNPAFSRFQTTL